jgi:hypothetical protein
MLLYKFVNNSLNVMVQIANKMGPEKVCDPYARGYNWATLFLGEINTGTWRSWLGGSLKNRDNKICSWVPWDSDLWKATLAMPGKN